MPIDGILLNKILHNINNNLPMRINKISSFSNTEICFNVHSKNKRTSLVVSMHPEDCHIRLSNKTYNDFKEPNNFIMVLRKHLTNGIIHKIEQYEYDRYLHIYIKNLDELYDDKNYILVVELMGKYSNIILVNEDTNKIVDAYKKITPAESSKRILLPNLEYRQIESQNKLDPFTKPKFNVEESFVNQLQGFSKNLEKEVRFRMQNNSFDKIMKEIANSNDIYIMPSSSFHIIPLTNESNDYKKYDLINGLDSVYYIKNEKSKIKYITDDIYKIVNKNIKHEKEKLNKLNNHLNITNDYNQDKTFADLLYMNDNLDAKGKKEISINNNIISLDPKLSIKQNANKYYQKYNKKKKGINYLNEQIIQINSNINFLNKVNEELSIANHIDVEQIKEELINNGYIKTKVKPKPSKHKTPLYQIKYNNHTITFGKNSTQNNYLTFSYAKRDDTFFHAKQYHGSHVVVSGNKLDENTIRFAANIAAYYSNGRLSSSVPIDYCQIKDVKKIKGSKLGLVSIQNYKTIFIDPEQIDESLIINI